ncbi:hypothetical protein ACTZWT_15730 [Rhodopseudomonas sp. NSM]|uniref:hypothetical protein n=1 Tax=Rhodopseudomonas sp. NSM TaxID=3457630 RepID=UPI004035DE45
MPADFPEAAVLFRAPFSRHALEEGAVDFSVQLVDIDSVDPVLEPIVFGLEASNGCVVLAPLVGVALQESGTQPVDHKLSEVELGQESGEPL